MVSVIEKEIFHYAKNNPECSHLMLNASGILLMEEGNILVS